MNESLYVNPSLFCLCSSSCVRPLHHLTPADVLFHSKAAFFISVHSNTLYRFTVCRIRWVVWFRKLRRSTKELGDNVHTCTALCVHTEGTQHTYSHIQETLNHKIYTSTDAYLHAWTNMQRKALNTRHAFTHTEKTLWQMIGNTHMHGRTHKHGLWDLMKTSVLSTTPTLVSFPSWGSPQTLQASWLFHYMASLLTGFPGYGWLPGWPAMAEKHIQKNSCSLQLMQRDWTCWQEHTKTEHAAIDPKIHSRIQTMHARKFEGEIQGVGWRD